MEIKFYFRLFSDGHRFGEFAIVAEITAFLVHRNLHHPFTPARNPDDAWIPAPVVATNRLIILVLFATNITQVLRPIVGADAIDVVDAQRINAVRQFPDKAMKCKYVTENIRAVVATALHRADFLTCIAFVPYPADGFGPDFSGSKEHPLWARSPSDDARFRVIGKKSTQEAL